MVKKKKSLKEIQRKIHFFGYSAHLFANPKKEIDPFSIFQAVNKLPLQQEGDEHGRYLDNPQDPGKDIFIVSTKEDTQTGKIFGRIAYARRDARPSVEKRGNGTIEPIEGMKEDDGIVELTHFILFTEDRVMAVEYNHNGPRAGTIADYLEKKSKSLLDIFKLQQITNRDFQSQLLRVNDQAIKTIKIGIPVNKIPQIAESTSLLEAFRNADEYGQSEEIEIIWKPMKRSRAMLKKPIERLKAAIGKNNKKPGDIFSGLSVTGVSLETGKTEEFDLLKEHLVSHIALVEQNSDKEINSDDVFKKIERAYIALRGEIIETLQR